MKNNRISQQAFQRMNKFESLESRICLDGSIQVEIDQIPGMEGNTAIITGDELNNHLTIEKFGVKSFRLEGKFFDQNGTLIDGATSKEIQGVNNFLIDLGGGNDKIFINGDLNQGASQLFQLDGDMKIYDEAGSTNVVVEDAIFRGDFLSEFVTGNNSVQLIDSIVRDQTSIFGGNKKDFVGLFRSRLTGDFHAELNHGGDSFWTGSTENGLEGSVFRGKVHVDTGAGPDSVKLDQSRFRNNVDIKTGAGHDELFSRFSSYVAEGDFNFDTGHHMDFMEFQNPRFKAKTTEINSGPGVDQISITQGRFLKLEFVNGVATISAGAHQDVVNISDTFFGVTAEVNGNGGNDQLNVDGVRVEGSGMPDANGEIPQQPTFSMNGGRGVDNTSVFDLIINSTNGWEESPFQWKDNNPRDQIVVENLSLNVTTSPDVHDRITELLESLRRLNDIQVTIEVRYITLSDNFFERIGIDFDFDLNDNIGSVNYANNDSLNGTVIKGSATVTPDLNLNFDTDFFSSAVPQFGGFDASSAASFGFAILSDIEVFFLLQAAKAEERSNLMFAPKVTLFNGQTAFINDQVTRPFVTSVIPVVG